MKAWMGGAIVGGTTAFMATPHFGHYSIIIGILMTLGVRIVALGK